MVAVWRDDILIVYRTKDITSQATNESLANSLILDKSWWLMECLPKGSIRFETNQVGAGPTRYPGGIMASKRAITGQERQHLEASLKNYESAVQEIDQALATAPLEIHPELNAMKSQLNVAIIMIRVMLGISVLIALVMLIPPEVQRQIIAHFIG